MAPGTSYDAKTEAHNSDPNVQVAPEEVEELLAEFAPPQAENDERVAQDEFDIVVLNAEKESQRSSARKLLRFKGSTGR